MGSDNNVFLKSISKMFDDAVKILGVKRGLANQIKSCNSTHTIRFGVKLDSGIKTFTGWRAVHSEHLEPVKGGIRYSPHIKTSEIEALISIVLITVNFFGNKKANPQKAAKIMINTFNAFMK